MAKDPAFLFYTGDFSTGTQFLTDDQLGKFLRLLMAQHQHGHLSEKQVIHICKSYDNDILEKFSKDPDGLYYNIRLETEINNRKRWTESRGQNKLGKSKTKISPSKKHLKSYDSHMEDENENKDENIITTKVVMPFDSDNFKNIWDVWILYRKERKISYKGLVSEQAALKALSSFDEQYAIGLIEKSMANNWQGLIFDKTHENYAKYKQTNGSSKQNIGAEIDDLIGSRGY